MVGVDNPKDGQVIPIEIHLHAVHPVVYIILIGTPFSPIKQSSFMVNNDFNLCNSHYLVQTPLFSAQRHTFLPRLIYHPVIEQSSYLVLKDSSA